ncbi:MAG: hypothetical protein E7813_25780, partial [Bradyrhizobium sp.]|uniref:bifunctional DNA primase/polymerase n=1 Tax=Bradyrhizobium sp. TaxID=376 RepID=UPI00120660B5
MPERKSITTQQFRVAVQAAKEAYASSWRMLDAALAYAAHGVPVFPLDPVSKAPIPKRDPDPTGRDPKGIPRTGGFYKATCDPVQIAAWWKRGRRNLIGVPMGPRSGVWALDVDTDVEHNDNGILAWSVLSAEHGETVTREHRTASEGLHLIFNWEDGRPIGCSAGSLPGGIEVKGVGGYIVVPPSRREGRGYYVGVDIEPVDAPAWLVEIIGIRKERVASQARPSRHVDAGDDDDDGDDEGRVFRDFADQVDIADPGELADAMAYVPNDDLPWFEWNKRAMALFVATGGSEFGYELLDALSKKSSKSWINVKETPRQCWERIRGSPPNAIGAEYLFKIATDNGWRVVAPPLPDPEFSDPERARAELSKQLQGFFELVAEIPEPNVFQLWAIKVGAKRPDPPPVQAICSSTGLGKTQLGTKEAVRFNSRTRPPRPRRRLRRSRIMYLVPTLDLGVKVVGDFAEQGANFEL